MSGQLTERLAPPEDLRPAQLGIILVGRVIIGHISATLIDLSGRGFLRIGEVSGGESARWLLTDLRDQAASPYTMIFGLTALPGSGDDPAASHSGEIPWGRLDDFSRAWANWVNDSCGSGGHGGSGDFTDQWSAPSSHDHGNAGRRAGYDEYGGSGANSGGVNYSC